MTLRERACQRVRSAGRDDGGALTLSYVVVLPVVFLFLMSVIQASFWFLARDAALAAARQGADAARAVGSSLTAGQSTALGFARQAGSRSTTMVLPIAMLAAGFLVLLIFPDFYRIFG